MDVERITAKAVARGLVSMEESARLDERAKLQFVFLPGLQHRREGDQHLRVEGSAMDVVKTKIEGLGGSISIDSIFGKTAAKMTLKLPPSMSIIRTMLVEVGTEKYAIPLENVRETVKVSSDAIHEVAGHGVFKLRDEILPVVNILNEFDLSCVQASELPAIIVEKNDIRSCLLVSRLVGQQEIVVKHLGKDLRHSGYFSGATILGDGRVAMILDVGAFT